MSEKPVLFMTYAANDLSEVDIEAQQTWGHVAEHSSIHATKLEDADITSLVKAIIPHRPKLYFFHFSGHATNKGLTLDGNRFLDRVKFSRVLMPNNQAKHKLQWVFLNGCESFGHVSVLLAKGAKAVIATNHKVLSKNAMKLADIFYQCFFKENMTLGDSFQYADTVLEGDPALIIPTNPGEPFDDAPIATGWTLYINSEYIEVQNWTLEDFIQNSQSQDPKPDVPINPGNQHGIETSIQNFSVPEELKANLEKKFLFNDANKMIGEIKKVNCNRIEEFKKMQKHFNDAGLKEKHKFYVVQSCYSQMPENLIQQFLLVIKEKNENLSFQYQKNDESSQFISIMDITPTDDIVTLEKAFMHLVSQGQAVNHNNFNLFIKEELSKCKQTYIATCYRFYLNQWDIQDLESILRDWLSYFTPPVESGPKCIFFFIIVIESIHRNGKVQKLSPEYKKKTKGISKFTKSLPSIYQQSSVLEELPQVEEGHLTTWLQQVLRTTRANNHEELIEQWCQIKGRYPDKVRDQNLHDMEFCSTLIEAIWHCHPSRKPIPSK